MGMRDLHALFVHTAELYTMEWPEVEVNNSSTLKSGIGAGAC